MLKLFKAPEKILKYLLSAILIFIPLYPKFPFIRIPGTYVSVRPEDFLIFFLFIFLAIIFFPRYKKIFSEKIENSILIYIIVGLISLFSAVFVIKSVGVMIGTLHWARRIEYFIPFFAGVYILKSKNSESLEFFIKILVVVTLLAFVYGLGQRYANWPVIITQNEEYAKGIALRWIPGSHINSTFAGHYDLASFLVMTLPIFITSFFIFKERKTRVILLMTVLAGLWLLINAVSRISVISYLLSSCLALLLAKRYKAIPIIVVASLIFFGLSSDLRARYFRVIEVTIGKVKQLILTQTFAVNAAEEIVRESPSPTPILVFEDRSTSIRLNVEWPRAIRAFFKNPILGTGFSSITLATDNDFLRLLVETGTLGFLAFVLILLHIGILIANNLSKISFGDDMKSAFMAGMVGALPGILLNALFIDIFEASKFAIVFWLMAGFLVSLLRSSNYEQNT